MLPGSPPIPGPDIPPPIFPGSPLPGSVIFPIIEDISPPCPGPPCVELPPVDVCDASAVVSPSLDACSAFSSPPGIKKAVTPPAISNTAPMETPIQSPFLLLPEDFLPFALAPPAGVFQPPACIPGVPAGKPPNGFPPGAAGMPPRGFAPDGGIGIPPGGLAPAGGVGKPPNGVCPAAGAGIPPSGLAPTAAFGLDCGGRPGDGIGAVCGVTCGVEAAAGITN